MLVKYCYLTGLLVLPTTYYPSTIQVAGQHDNLTKLLILKKY